MQSRNNTAMQYVEYWVSDKRLWSYQGDKVIIWQKKIKMAAMTRIFFQTFWKTDAG